MGGRVLPQTGGFTDKAECVPGEKAQDRCGRAHFSQYIRSQCLGRPSKCLGRVSESVLGCSVFWWMSCVSSFLCFFRRRRRHNLRFRRQGPTLFGLRPRDSTWSFPYRSGPHWSWSHDFMRFSEPGLSGSVWTCRVYFWGVHQVRLRSFHRVDTRCSFG